MVVSNAFEIELSNDTKLVASKTLEKLIPKKNSLESAVQRGIITQFDPRRLMQKLQRQHFSIPFSAAGLDLLSYGSKACLHYHKPT